MSAWIRPTPRLAGGVVSSLFLMQVRVAVPGERTRISFGRGVVLDLTLGERFPDRGEPPTCSL